MNNRILVTYASRYGSTAEIAQRVGDVLAKRGYAVDVLPLAEATAPGDYDGFVLGGAIYSGQWPPEVCEFVGSNEHLLRDKHAALFVVAIRLREAGEEMRQSVLSTIDTCRVMVEPDTIGLFAGKIDYDTLSPIVRLQVQTKNLPEGDFRDWAAIEAWADEVAAAFKQSLPVEPVGSPTAVMAAPAPCCS